MTSVYRHQQRDHTFANEVAAAAAGQPVKRGARSKRGKEERARIQENLSRIIGTINTAQRHKPPQSISLVRAFLACSPDTRTPDFFARVIDRGLEDGLIRIRWLRGTPEDLSKALRDDWFDHCTREGNQHLPASQNSIRDMGFIAMMLKNHRYSKMRVSLPTSAPAKP